MAHSPVNKQQGMVYKQLLGVNGISLLLYIIVWGLAHDDVLVDNYLPLVYAEGNSIDWPAKRKRFTDIYCRIK